MNNPELYAENSDIAHDISESIMNKYESWLSWKENEMIMDIGIGSGEVTKQTILPRIKSNFRQYVGVDINKNFLSLAQRILMEDTRFRFVEMDIATDIVPNDLIGKFDHILSFLTLHWVKNPRKSFENMYKMLKPDGELFLMYFAKVPIDYAFTELGKDPKWAKYDHSNYISPYFHSSDPLRDCEKDLLAAGIKNYKIQIENMVSRFPSETNFKNLLYSVNPMLKDIPKEEVEDYKRDFVDYALKKGGYYADYDEHGEKFIGSKYSLIVIYAKK
ncbi:unnamed protein product [Phaedon cochleariae]|uniref:Methyltransferase type 11 domain-containing protein n=1 Tax=Phaedon cochleariae TaxID=80249 RepID=A0A9N9S8T2_PHACE|nr:unnamed protein product [Phaedon cochleariae]